jgi:hypothetical protein
MATSAIFKHSIEKHRKPIKQGKRQALRNSDLELFDWYHSNMKPIDASVHNHQTGESGNHGQVWP